jgi:hypothetical protein
MEIGLLRDAYQALGRGLSQTQAGPEQRRRWAKGHVNWSCVKFLASKYTGYRMIIPKPRRPISFSVFERERPEPA